VQCSCRLGRLREELEEAMGSGNTKAAEVMRELIESIIVSHNPDAGKSVSIEIRGRLRSLLDSPKPKSALRGALHGGAHEVGSHGIGAGGTGVFTMASFGMSRDRYNSPSEEHRRIVDEVAAETPAKAMEFLDESVQEAVEKHCAAKDKITVHFFTPEEAEKVREIAGSKLESNWHARVAAETSADGEALLEEFMGYVESYEPDSTYVPGFERFQNTCGQN
jgi:hypothetical protein